MIHRYEYNFEMFFLSYFTKTGNGFNCFSSVGKIHEKKWNENGTSYECRTEANAMKRRCVKFRLCKYWKYNLKFTFPLS